MTIAVGDKLPDVTLRLVTSGGAEVVQTKDFFAGKTIVMFGLPGAFTPTCHKNHLPGFLANEAQFRAKGVDEIAMTSVNDPFVLAAWQAATNSEGRIRFLADGGAVFAKALGLDFDGTERGMGVRSKRYSMLVKDGVVQELNVEPNPGVADLSGAEHILGQMK
jgi:glutaredoxin/glutathione-dependent peroxiredoxin